MGKEVIKKDMIIIGAGMAGLTAALYAGRMNLSVSVSYTHLDVYKRQSLYYHIPRIIFNTRSVGYLAAD